MKNVLMIAYYFPPWGGAGVQRTLKFVKYLPQFGWQPIVVTTRERDALIKDLSLVDEVPKETVVFRTPALNLRSLGFVKEAIGFRRRNEVTGRNKTSPLVKTLNWVRSFLLVPDEEIVWLLPAIAYSLKAFYRNNIDVIYTTSKPYTAHLVGLVLHFLTRKPWVADFRDLWTDNPLLKVRRIENLLEKLVMVFATKVIANTSKMQEIYEIKYKKRDKFITITNGYDEKDFKKIETAQLDERFRICHAGGFYTNIEIRCSYSIVPKWFLGSLGELISEDKQILNDIEVLFLCEKDPLIQYQIDELKLEHVVNITGHVTHELAIEFMAKSDVLLLIMYDDTNTRATVPQKTYEYLRIGKPILLLSDQNSATELVSRYNFAKIVHPLDTAGIKEAIRELYGLWKSKSLKNKNRQDSLEQFERRKLTSTLADLFSTVSGAK